RVCLAESVEKGRAERRAILSAEVEHLTNLDAAILLENALATARTEVADHCLTEVDEDHADAEVAPVLDAGEILVVLIGADHRTADAAQRVVGDDRRVEPDRAGEADRNAGRALHDVRVGERDPLRTERDLE